ncbi:ferric-chelate reductase Frp1 [Savitreella phatthalungensis]
MPLHDPIKSTILYKWNRVTLKYYVGLSLIVLFIALIHHHVISRLRFKPTRSRVRGWLLRRAWYSDRMHMLALAVYVGVNVVACSWDSSFARPYKQIYKRTGWVCIANMPILYLLATRILPLPHNKLRLWHIVTGYTTLVLMTIHTFLAVASMHYQDYWYLVWDNDQAWGWIASWAWWLIGATAVLSIARSYEVFYVTHVVGGLFALPAIALHNTRCRQVVYACAAIWVVDRLYRLVLTRRVTATSQVIANGVRLTIADAKSRPAGKVHLAVPAIRQFETHPLQLAPDGTILVHAERGFTRDLALHAATTTVRDPDATIKMWVEGPYTDGRMLRLTQYTHFVFVASGSGITYTMPLALHYARATVATTRPVIEFIWVSSGLSASWYTAELTALQELGVTLRIYDSSLPHSSTTSSASSISDAAVAPPNHPKLPELKVNEKSHDTLHPCCKPPSLPVSQGRPDLHALFSDVALSAADTLATVAVVVCGGSTFTTAVRDAVSGMGSIGDRCRWSYFEDSY